MFFAMTASKNALYITVPAPSFAKGAMVGGSAVIMLRSSFDELTTFTPHGAMISGGTLLIEGVINPEAHSSNTCYAGWFEKCDLDVSWE